MKKPKNKKQKYEPLGTGIKSAIWDKHCPSGLGYGRTVEIISFDISKNKGFLTNIKVRGHGAAKDDVRDVPTSSLWHPELGYLHGTETPARLKYD